MTTYPAERPLGLAVKALLEVELGAGKAGYGAKPSAGGGSPFVGYAVVYVGQTTPGEGSASDASTDGVQGFQVSAFGSSAEQADAIRDRCRARLLGNRLALAGRYCEPTQLADATNVRPDTDVEPWIYQADDRFTVTTFPA